MTSAESSHRVFWYTVLYHKTTDTRKEEV